MTTPTFRCCRPTIRSLSSHQRLNFKSSTCFKRQTVLLVGDSSSRTCSSVGGCFPRGTTTGSASPSRYFHQGTSTSTRIVQPRSSNRTLVNQIQRRTNVTSTRCKGSPKSGNSSTNTSSINEGLHTPGMACLNSKMGEHLNSTDLLNLNAVMHQFVGTRGMLLPVQDETSGNLYPREVSSGWMSGIVNNDNNSSTPSFANCKAPSNYGDILSDTSVSQNLASSKLVMVGEVHSVPAVVALELWIAQLLHRSLSISSSSSSQNTCSSVVDDKEEDGTTKKNNSNNQQTPTLHIIMEHFSFEMQTLLDRYMHQHHESNNNSMSFEQFCQEYDDVGTEHHDLIPYQPLLEWARKNTSSIKIHGGFIPREHAKHLLGAIKEDSVGGGGGDARQRLLLQTFADPEHNYIPVSAIDDLRGDASQDASNAFHYNLFDSLISGRNLHNADTIKPGDNFRRIYVAQLLKDIAMAHKVNSIIQQESCNSKDKFLIIAGRGHLMHYQGVPERVLRVHPEIRSETQLVICDTELLQESTNAHNNVEMLRRRVCDLYGPCGANVGDMVFLCKENEAMNTLVKDETKTTEHIGMSKNAELKHDNSQSKDHSNNVKEETRQAYDSVGSTAHLEGNVTRAKAIMKRLRYDDEDIEWVASSEGFGIYNYQGVGNPHLNANIQPHEKVLDVGCGLGIDSYIALRRIMQNANDPDDTQEKRGTVTGIDLSTKEVAHADECRQRCNIAKDVLNFHVADMEQTNSTLFVDNTFDVVISNGALCLSGNKEAALKEMYRVLKPGGRISVWTSTLRQSRNESLPSDVDWPICMQMFIPQNELVPLCQKAGFENVWLDETDDQMTFDLEEEEEEEEVVGDKDASNTNNRDIGESSLNPHRKRVHATGTNPAFKHLERFDMNELCARVCLVATKPREK